MPTSSKPKVLIFAPREEPPETISALEGLGCEIVVGDRDWQLPRASHEEAVVEAARDAVALMGTSIRHTPITRRIMQASQRLRVVAKYTVGVDDIDTEAATELGVMVCHAPTKSNCFGVAETTVTLMLSLLKKLAERDADVREGKWRTADNFAYYVGAAFLMVFAARPSALSASAASASRVAQLLTRGARASSPMTLTFSRRISWRMASQSWTTRPCCANPTWCRSTSCSRKRPATCSARSRSS